MRLIKDDILAMCERNRKVMVELLQTGKLHPGVQMMAERHGFTLDQAMDELIQDATDILVVRTCAEKSQTILFSAEQALYLRPALQRFNDQPFFKLPFDSLILQFDRPIDEKEFFQIEPQHYTAEKGDKILGIVLARYEGTYNAIAFFESAEIQRVKWLEDDPEFLKFVNANSQFNEKEGIDNKKQLQLLSMAAVFYLNCKNIEIEKVEVDPKVNRKRVAKGKTPLSDYYACRVVKTHYATTSEQEAEEEKRQGSKHSFRYDVKGFFRRVGGGETIWIAPHQRGLTHEIYKPKVYEVKRDERR